MLIVKMPGYIKDENFRLRPLRVFDVLFIKNGLMDEIILKASELREPINSSWFSFWWRIKKTFIPAYCIEYDSKRIGFIGLYNLMIGKSAEVSLVIFDKNNRRMGYGSRAFKLFTQGIQRHSVIEKIVAKVKKDNHIARSFWRKLGFVETDILDGIIDMSMDLNSYREGYKIERTRAFPKT